MLLVALAVVLSITAGNGVAHLKVGGRDPDSLIDQAEFLPIVPERGETDNTQDPRAAAAAARDAITLAGACLARSREEAVNYFGTERALNLVARYLDRLAELIAVAGPWFSAAQADDLRGDLSKIIGSLKEWREAFLDFIAYRRRSTEAPADNFDRRHTLTCENNDFLGALEDAVWRHRELAQPAPLGSKEAQRMAFEFDSIAEMEEYVEPSMDSLLNPRLPVRRLLRELLRAGFLDYQYQVQRGVPIALLEEVFCRLLRSGWIVRKGGKVHLTDWGREELRSQIDDWSINDVDGSVS